MKTLVIVGRLNQALKIVTPALAQASLIFAPLVPCLWAITAYKSKSWDQLRLFCINWMVAVLLAGGHSVFVFPLQCAIGMSLFTVVRSGVSSRRVYIALAGSLLFALLVLHAYLHSSWGTIALEQLTAVLGDSFDRLVTVLDLKAISEDKALRAQMSERLIWEVPTNVASLLLIVITLNYGLLARWLRGELLDDFLVEEHTVWLVIVLGLITLSDVGMVSEMALSGLKVIAVLYGVQGLAVLSSLLKQYTSGRFFRWAVMLLVAFLSMLAIVGLGFFDLWFDFRGRFRLKPESQSEK